MAESGQLYWTGENYELELSKYLLSQENMALRSEIKSLRNLLDESAKLIDDLEEICRGSAVMEVPTCTCTVRDNNRELELEEKHQLSLKKINQDLHEKETTINFLNSLNQEHLATMEELRTENRDLKVQIWKAMVFPEPHVDQPMAGADQGQLPHSNVEFSDVEKENEDEEEIKQEVQTKSWWRRQANKVVKGMGTFRRHFRCCLGTRKRGVV